jgi:hypothetical protein
MVNTILCYAEDPHGNRVEVSVMPDIGSQENIAHSKFLKGLALETIDLGENGPKIKGVKGSKPIQLSHLSRLKLIPRDGTDRAMEVPVFLIDQPGQWSARIPKRIPNWLARRKDLADLRIGTITSSVPIHVILDVDFCNQIVASSTEIRKDGLVLHKTIFGHIVSVKYIPSCPDWAYQTGATVPAFSILQSNPEYLAILGDEHVAQKVEWHLATDAIDIYRNPYAAEFEGDTTASEFLELYMSQLTRLPDGRIEEPLIINPNFQVELSTNEHLAKPRHARNLQVIQEQTPLAQGYKRAMDEIVSICCEEVSTTDFEQLQKSGEKWCKLPIHPAENPGSVTMPYRPVMDASAFEKGQQPLNKYILSGPNIMPVIQNILRKFQIAP